ncbi:MAG: chemotaxis protein CheX [Candidatus Hydrogenedentota bacterium]
MKADYLNPFTESAVSVISQLLDDQGISRGLLQVRDDPVVSSGVATMIGINGRLLGHVVYDMDRGTAIQIATVMNGEDMPGINSLVRSTINELANMISGNAMIMLESKGFHCNITPPTFMMGERSEIYAAKGSRHLIVPFDTKCGRVTLSLSLSEAPL